MKFLYLLLAVAAKSAISGDVDSCEQTTLLQQNARHSALAPCPEVEAVYDLFDTVGFLSTAMPTSAATAAVAKGSLELQDLIDCGSPGRDSCSAWTLFRNDLPPMNFGAGGAFISVLVDPEKAWDLVSSMSIPDGNTDARRACGNSYTYQPAVSKPGGGFGDGNTAFGPGHASLPGPGEAWHCMTQKATAAGVAPGDVVYQPAGDVGQTSVPASCPEDDDRCRFLNSGGCLSKAVWGNATACTNPSDPLFPQFQSCYTFTEVAANHSEVKVDNFTGKYFEVSFDQTCSPCAIPNKCITQDSPNPAAPGYFPFYNQSADEFQMLVGSDGSQWTDRIYGTDTLRYGIQTQWFSGNFQCKWDKSDWSSWTNALQLNYETLLLSAENGPPNGGNTWLWAYPSGPWGFYNEVNFYVDNDKDSTQYSKQNNIFSDSIVGIAVNQQSCHSQLSFLDGTCSSKSPGDPVCCDVDCRCPWENLTEFEIDLQEATDAAVQFSALLEDQLQRKIPVLKSYPASSTAPNRKVFEAFSSSNGYPARQLLKPL